MCAIRCISLADLAAVAVGMSIRSVPPLPPIRYCGSQCLGHQLDRRGALAFRSAILTTL